MRKFLILVSLCIVLAGTLAAVNGSNPAPDKKGAICLTSAVGAYPEPAPLNAPVVALNPQAGAPQLYAQIQLLTKNERLKFFNVLSGRNQAKVWVIHIQNYALDHQLSADQQAYVDKLLSLLRNVDYSVDAERIKANRVGLKAEALALFGAVEGWELIGHLGGKSPFADNKQIAHFVVAGNATWNKPACECNSNDDYCSFWYDNNFRCSPPTNECDYQSVGCGTLGVLNCWGMCHIF